MSVAVSARAPLRALGIASVENKGLILGHAIGLSLFVYLIADRFKYLAFQIPHTKVMDLPIRFVAIWLLLDRFGRSGRTRFGLWDFTYILFCALYGLGVVYADLFMWRQTGFLNYVDWTQDILSPFLFFIVVREACLRKGFRADVTLLWALGTLSFCALLGLGQALNVLGIRSISMDVYRWEYYDQFMLGPSAEYQARGTAAHANAHAIFMVSGFCMAPMLYHWPKYRKWILPFMAIFVLGVYATYSRMGIVSLFATMFGFGLFLLVRRSYNAAFGIMGALVFLAGCFLLVIYGYDVKRYKTPLEGQGVVKGATGSFSSLEARKNASMAALTVGSRFPLWGVNAVGGAINEPRVLSKNPYSFDAVLNSLLPYTFASYGVVGLLFLAGLYFGTLRVPWLRSRTTLLDAAIFMLGIMLLAWGITENVVFLQQQMSVVNIALGLFYGFGWRKLAASEPVEAISFRKWRLETSPKALLPR